MDRLADRFLSGYAGMSDDEIFVLVVCGVLVLVGLHQTRVSSYPRQYTEKHPGIGLMRLAVAASLVWTALVIHYYGDPSIKGIYVTFYIVMAYAAVKLFGQVGAQMFGVRLGSDVLRADLGVHLHAYGKDGLYVGRAVAADNGQLQGAESMHLPEPSFKTAGFFRSSAGGFGAPVPHPSSGG